MWCQQKRDLIHCVLVVFAPAAYIAYPGREVGYRDELVDQPGEIGNPDRVHMTCLASRTEVVAGFSYFCHIGWIDYTCVLGHWDAVTISGWVRLPILFNGQYTNNAFPTTWSSGTKPQACESDEELRLSPRTKRLPSGTVHEPL
jgi:hypothetical protein